MSLSLNVAQSIYSYILNTYAQLPLQLPPEQPSAPYQLGRIIEGETYGIIDN